MEKSLDGIKYLELLLERCKKLQNNGFWLESFFLMINSIELFGTLIDKKPIRARAQSRKRFSNAIDKLFPLKYKQLNTNHFLYEKLRNHFIHSTIPSSYIIFSHQNNAKYSDFHLQKIDNKIVVIAEKMLDDIIVAKSRLDERIEKGILIVKKLPYFDFE